MANELNIPRIHPVIEALLARRATGSPAIIEGFVGEAREDTVRVFPSLSLERYIDIPQAAVLHIEEVPNQAGAARLFVEDTAQITLTVHQTQTVSAKDFSSTISGVSQDNGQLPTSSRLSTRIFLAPLNDADNRTNRECEFDCWLAELECDRYVDEWAAPWNKQAGSMNCFRKYSRCVEQCRARNPGSVFV